MQHSRLQYKSNYTVGEGKDLHASFSSRNLTVFYRCVARATCLVSTRRDGPAVAKWINLSLMQKHADLRRNMSSGGPSSQSRSSRHSISGRDFDYNKGYRIHRFSILILEHFSPSDRSTSLTLVDTYYHPLFLLTAFAITYVTFDGIIWHTSADQYV